METIMDFANGFTEAQSIYLRANAVNDLRQAIVFVVQFLTQLSCVDDFSG